MSRARAALALAVTFALGGCGGAPRAASGAASETGGALGPVDTSLPADAPIFATVRAAQIAPLFGVLLAMLDPDQSAGIVERLALDPVRASSAALFSGGATLDEVARRITALVPAARDAVPTPDLQTALAAAVGPGRDVPIHARIVLASTEPASTFDVIGTFLTGAHFAKWPRTPAGFDGVYAKHDDGLVLALCHDEQNVVIEVLDFPFATTAAAQHDRARAELERIRSGVRRSTATTPALADDELGRIVVLARSASTLDFLMGVGTASRATAHVAPSDRDALLGAGLFEAAGALTLVGDARGAYAERIEIVGRGALASLETTTRITLGPALAGAIAPGVLAQALSISPPGFGYAEANAAALSVALPHLDGEPATPASFKHLLAETGGSAPYLYALPHVIVLVLRSLLEQDTDLPIPQPIRDSADRIGAMFGEHEGVRVALLPAGTTTVEAALALPHATGTPRPRMLSYGHITTIGSASAMTVGVGDRFAVLVSDDAQVLRAARVELTPSSAVATATLVLSAFPPVFGLSRLPLAQTYRFALEATPTEWILHATPGTPSP